MEQNALCHGGISEWVIIARDVFGPSSRLDRYGENGDANGWHIGPGDALRMGGANVWASAKGRPTSVWGTFSALPHGGRVVPTPPQLLAAHGDAEATRVDSGMKRGALQHKIKIGGPSRPLFHGDIGWVDLHLRRRPQHRLEVHLGL